MPDAEILAYTEATGAFNREDAALISVIFRVLESARQVNNWLSYRKIPLRGSPPAVGLLSQNDWPDRDEINAVLTKFNDAALALRKAWDQLTVEDQAKVAPLPK